jgi:hypothetical protein
MCFDFGLVLSVGFVLQEEDLQNRYHCLRVLEEMAKQLY